MLFGDWWGQDDVGDCIDVRSWYSFATDGTVVNRQIDHDACSGNRLITKVEGTYALEGRMLTITLNGLGSERPFDMTPPSVEIREHSEEMTVAVAEAPRVVGRDGQVFLDAKAFSSSDGELFASARRSTITRADSTQEFRQRNVVMMRLNPGLPLAAGDHTEVEVDVELARFEPSVDADMTEKAATIAIHYPATIREELGWLRIMPDALDGLDGQAAIDAWHQVLDDNGLTSQPEWARRLFDAELYPSQRFQAGDITVLSSTLPEWGRWTQSAEPPPIL